MIKDYIRTELEKRIMAFLEKPDLSAMEIKYLAEAYSELNKNDWMQVVLNQPTYLNTGFGGLGNANSEVMNIEKE